MILLPRDSASVKSAIFLSLETRSFKIFLTCPAQYAPNFELLWEQAGI